MTKLRLIKPWGLRTVRQHLNEMPAERLAPASFIMCTGPVCAIEEVCNTRFSAADIRSAKNFEVHTAYRVAAPEPSAALMRFAAASIR